MIEVPSTGSPSTGQTEPTASEAAPRSSYAEAPGSEMPQAVYVTLIGAFAWMFLVAWVFFHGPGYTDLNLFEATLLAVIMLGLPVLLVKQADRKKAADPALQDDTTKPRSGMVDVFTEQLSEGDAAAQILIIPLTLAFGATLIGIVWAVVS